MDKEINPMEKIVQTVQSEFASRYRNEGNYRELVKAIQKYKSMPITNPSTESEVSLVLEDVFLITKEKTLKNGEKIPVYEIFDASGTKVLETLDDGMIKFDKEIIDELIKDKVKIIEAAGYDVAGIDTLEDDGKIESFLELVNGKVTAINKEQKDRLDRDEEREHIMDDLDGETANPEINEVGMQKAKQQYQEQQEKNKQGKEQSEEEKEKQVKQNLGISIFKMAKINDPIFKMNNPGTRGKDVYAAYTQSGEVQIITFDDGVPQLAEGFGRSSSASGRTVKIVNDTDSLEDNEINTYGEIYPTNRNDMRYTIEKDQYGGIKLVEQIRYDGSKISETDKWISREVESSNTDYLDVNREGAENSQNITARTFNRSSTNRDAARYGHTNGKGGTDEIGKALKDNKPLKTTMESFAADSNQRFEEAKRMVVDVANKEGASLDPDTEAAVDKRVQEIIEKTNVAFDEDIAEQVLIEVKAEMADKNKETSEPEHNEDEGRSRLEEEMNRRRRI